MTQGQLLWPAEIRRYIVGGNATFTVVFGPEGERHRYTFRVKSGKRNKDAYWSTSNADKSIYFVSVLTGSNNDSDYTYIGLMRQTINCDYRFEPKLKDGQMHFAAAIFESLWKPLELAGKFYSGYEFFHEGQCCVCGRKLTVPESVANGIGPECMGGI